MCSSCIYFNL
jgi:hypothetical protein